MDEPLTPIQKLRLQVHTDLEEAASFPRVDVEITHAEVLEGALVPLVNAMRLMSSAERAAVWKHFRAVIVALVDAHTNYASVMEQGWGTLKDPKPIDPLDLLDIKGAL